MPKPTIDDAIALVTDPAYRVGGQPSDSAEFDMRGGHILDQLQQQGASAQKAQALVEKALHRVGGRNASYIQGFAETGTGGHDELVVVYRVPRHAMQNLR